MLAPELHSRLPVALARFHALYGDGPVSVLRAPARINILGEHVDYVSYLPTASLPFASHEHGMLMLFRANEDAQVRGASMLAAYEPFAFSLRAGPQAAASWEDYLFQQPAPAPHWSNYVKGAAFYASWRHGAPRGFSFLLDSNIPPRGGASSSSALTVLAGAAIRAVNQIAYTPAELARESAQAEWYCGTRGGALDHTAICLAERGHAVHLSYADNHVELVPLPTQHFRWLTFFAHEADKGRAVLLEYNERAAVARLLIPAVLAGRQLQENELPVALTLDEVARLYPQALRDCEQAFPALVRERHAQPLKLRDRARHHLGETRRVAEAVRVLRAAPVEEALRALGGLLDETHASLRDLYEVSTPEVERLREIIKADSQVLGARLMGGGFGGNVLALTMAENAAALVERVQREFYAPCGRDGESEGAVMISTPGEGLAQVAL